MAENKSRDTVIRTWAVVLLITFVVADYTGVVVLFSEDSTCVDGPVETAL